MKFSYKSSKLYYHLLLALFWVVIFVFYHFTAPEKIWVTYVSIFMTLFYLAHFLYQRFNHYVQIRENLLIVYVFPKRIISLCDIVDITIKGEEYSFSTSEQIVVIKRSLINPNDQKNFDEFIKLQRENLQKD